MARRTRPSRAKLGHELKNRRGGTGNVCGNYLRLYKDGVAQLMHIRVAEKALGKPLPAGAVVHHINENGLDNRPENLVICPDAAYHKLLHVRMRAMEATGDPSKRKCRHCKQWDDPANLFLSKSGNHHRACHNTYYRNRRESQ